MFQQLTKETHSEESRMKNYINTKLLKELFKLNCDKRNYFHLSYEV